MTHPTLFPAPAKPCRTPPDFSKPPSERFADVPSGEYVIRALAGGNAVVAARKELKSRRPDADKDTAASAAKEE